MTARETADMLDLLEENLNTLRGGGRLPAAWKYQSGTITLENGWPVADAVREERFLGSVEVRILRILLEHHHVKVQRFGPDSELDQAVAAPAELLPHEFERLGSS
jgi:hypothetical protein